MRQITQALISSVLVWVSSPANAQECVRPPSTSQDTSNLGILRQIQGNVEAEEKQQETTILANLSDPDKLIIDLILLYETCT
jgi:hypothetical protein